MTALGKATQAVEVPVVAAQSPILAPEAVIRAYLTLRILPATAKGES